MVKRITLGPKDIEIDHTHVDPIIHIFPNENSPEDVVINLLKGLSVIDAIIAKLEFMDEFLKTKKLNQQQIRDIINEREYFKSFLSGGERYANDVFEKITHK